MLADPIGTLCDIAQAHPGAVVKLPFGPVPLYFATHPQHAAHILIDNWRNYPKGDAMWRPLRRLLGQGLVTSQGDLWIRNRRIMQPLFTPKHLAGLTQSMVSVIDRSLGALARRVGSGARIDMEKEMAVISQNVVMETIFGASLQREEAERLTTMLLEALRAVNLQMFLFFVPKQLPMPGEKAFKRAILAFDEAMFRLVRERRASGVRRKDLLSLLLDTRYPDTGELVSDRQLRDELVTLFIAGNETTALNTTWLMYVLGRYPDIAAKVHAEAAEVLGGRLPEYDDLPRLRYAKMVVQEALRVYPPSWFIPRVAISNDKIGKYRIPGGSMVILSQYAIHHDPTWWPDPERFDPERFNPDSTEKRPRYTFLPFGAGPRHCLGDQFAIMESQLILAMISQRFRLHMTPETSGEPKAVTTLRPRDGMPMFLQRLG